jgi:FkbM family methyltransferase
MLPGSSIRQALRFPVESWVLSAMYLGLSRRPFSGRGALLGVAKRLSGNGKPVRVSPGIWVHLDLRNPYDELVFTGAYEPALFRLLSHVLSPGDLFIDGGANIGLHTLAAAFAVGPTGQVLAFEPDEDAYQYALANCELNPEIKSRIRLYKSALGDEKGVVLLAPNGDRHLESRIAVGGNPVECLTIDAAMEEVTSNSTMVVCKLDVEGYELRALAGAPSLLRRDNLIFVCELNDPLLRENGGSADDLIDTFACAGFSCWMEDGSQLVRHDPTWPPWANGVFVRGPLANDRLQCALGHVSRVRT